VSTVGGSGGTQPTIRVNVVQGRKSISCANSVLPVFMVGSSPGHGRGEKRNAQEYLAHWLGILRADSKALMTAAAKASAAATFIMQAERGVVVEPDRLAA
jgi:antirestriction protein ArdC